MTSRRVLADAVVPDVDWRERFVEDLGVLALDAGIPRATVRVLAWMVVCEPVEQSAADIRRALHLSAGAVSTATRTLIVSGMIERTAHPGDRHLYYKVRPGGWEAALQGRLRTLMQIREVADRALLAAPHADNRLRDLHDVYAWFEQRLEELLATRQRADNSVDPRARSHAPRTVRDV
jgi:DNA-binding transcriptional regulator GbsR (MarR family)